MEVKLGDNYKSTYLNGVLHSFNDEPATIEVNHIVNCSDDELREMLISGILDDRILHYTMKWYKNGNLHRDTIDPNTGDVAYATLNIYGNNSIKGWYVNGNLHREGNTALIDENKTCWYTNGLLNRDNGPAVIWNDGHAEWWLNGELQYECDDYIEPNNKVKSVRAIQPNQ